MLETIIGWFLKGPLDRMFGTIDKAIDNETKREEIKTRAVESYMTAQVAILTGRGWWFPLLFLMPAGLWFSGVCIYSLLFCAKCVFPQSWTVAALPPPLDQWMGAIVGSLFIGKAGGELLARLRK
jgi:hypothetical protein